eukprot:358490-Chlamydomonas_euryale.AAC.6
MRQQLPERGCGAPACSGRHRRRCVGTDRQHVGEKADQPMRRCVVAVGVRRADNDVALRDSVGGWQQLERAHARARNYKRHRAPAARRAWRALEVPRQLQQWRRAGERGPPILHVRGPPCGVGHQCALPRGVVKVAQRQRRQRRLSSLAQRAVRGPQLRHEHLHRPAVGDCVVHAHRYVVARRRLSHHRHVEQRATKEVERPFERAGRGLGNRAGASRRAQVKERVVQLELKSARQHDVRPPMRIELEVAAQHGVSLNQHLRGSGSRRGGRMGLRHLALLRRAQGDGDCGGTDSVCVCVGGGSLQDCHVRCVR